MTDFLNTLERIMTGQVTDESIEAFLLDLNQKEVSAAEIASAARVLRKHAVKFSKRIPCLLDTCGTGGDSSGTLNISTLSALTACAAGAKVAKHGNRSVSSVSGSADLIEALGIPLNLSPAEAEELLNKTGFTFLFAPNFHPAMRFAMPARRKIAGKTIFNLLGPLSNPAGPEFQVIGVYEKRLVGIMAQALSDLGCKRALVVHSLDGLDEISSAQATDCAELKNGQIEFFSFSPVPVIKNPSQSGLENALCRSKEDAARLAREVLSGKEGPALDLVALNAGAALYVTEKAGSIDEGAGLARETILSGKAKRKLEQIVRDSKRYHKK